MGWDQNNGFDIVACGGLECRNRSGQNERAQAIGFAQVIQLIATESQDEAAGVPGGFRRGGVRGSRIV